MGMSLSAPTWSARRATPAPEASALLCPTTRRAGSVAPASVRFWRSTTQPQRTCWSARPSPRRRHRRAARAGVQPRPRAEGARRADRAARLLERIRTKRVRQGIGASRHVRKSSRSFLASMTPVWTSTLTSSTRRSSPWKNPRTCTASRAPSSRTRWCSPKWGTGPTAPFRISRMHSAPTASQGSTATRTSWRSFARCMEARPSTKRHDCAKTPSRGIQTACGPARIFGADSPFSGRCSATSKVLETPRQALAPSWWTLESTAVSGRPRLASSGRSRRWQETGIAPRRFSGLRSSTPDRSLAEDVAGILPRATRRGRPRAWGSGSRRGARRGDAGRMRPR